MSELDNSPGDGSTTNELTQLILKEVRPYLQPNKINQAEQQIGAMVVQELYQEFHQGPLPAPRQLVQYEQALPGSAERIMTMAENEQSHRHTNETRLIKSEVNLKFIGQGLAFAALIVMICLIGFMVQRGYPIQAASLGAVMITGVVGLFLAPKFFNRPEQPLAKKAAPKAGRGGRRK